ncbi:uncharacterized protein LOC126657296 [Mercurialis annua]|uniref:uncharacterized protein LOC126657296 n=1 Tax=Mercurialis annua TaxID=3986 RepID=UPI0024AE8427|nr:uncharacterized protein LOC126657296 [Mercurialis annua]
MATKLATELPSTTVISCSLKRKRPPSLEIPNVLQEIQSDRLKFKDLTPTNEPFCFSDTGVAVSSIKGKKKFMEDAHKIVSRLNGCSNSGFFGVYDGHGGKKAVEFVAENLHGNILEMMVNCNGNESKEEAVKAGYLKTDHEFLKQGVVSGACCVTALIEGQEAVVSNLGDCRAVLCRGGVAEVLTKDHRAEREDERQRIENKGGYVEIHRGAWRVHGILSVSRSIGDAHLKDWVLGEPDTIILPLTLDTEFLVLASDGLWEEIGNQEVIDTVIASCMPEKKLGSKVDVQKDDVLCGIVNVSPSPKFRRVSLVKQQYGTNKQSPSNNKTILDSWHDDFACENESPPSKSRRISLVKRINVKNESPSKENSPLKKKPLCTGLVAACKELVNLAVSRGSLDDITVMIIDLKHFRNIIISILYSNRFFLLIKLPIFKLFSESYIMQITNEPSSTITRSGQSVFMSVYRTILANQCRLITITWCKNLLLHGLSISVQPTNNQDHHQECKIELKPWCFWRKQGGKQFLVDGKAVDVVWDLKQAKFNGETEPQSDYYVAVVSEGEVVLLLGDLKKDAYRRTKCRPSLNEPILVSRKEHVVGKRKFSTKIKKEPTSYSSNCISVGQHSVNVVGSFSPISAPLSQLSKNKIHEKDTKFHEISIECINGFEFDPKLEIKVDGEIAFEVKHLQWKFRGNEIIDVSKRKVEVYWDVHDWLFGSGPRYGLFIFKPVSSSIPLLNDQEVACAPREEDNACGSSSFCLFLYTWKVE